MLALPLTTGLTDAPVLALLGLALAGTAACPRRGRLYLVAAFALGAACAMKATAWPALPVLAAMLAARDGILTATRFVVTVGLTMAALVAATAPAAMTAPAALFQNTVLFPLGMTKYQTQADSPLPGHLLATTGPAGRWAAIGLLCGAALALGASLIVRPPADSQAAAWRLAVCLALLFALAPATRWGYFVYPAALLAFGTMTRTVRGPTGMAVRQKDWQTSSRVATGYRSGSGVDVLHDNDDQTVRALRDRVPVGQPARPGLQTAGAWQWICPGKGIGERGGRVFEKVKDRPVGSTSKRPRKSFELIPGPVRETKDPITH
jgi:hypothetical protein